MIFDTYPGFGPGDKPRPGDFQVIVFAAGGSTRCFADPDCWHLVGTTIDAGEIRLVYLRTGAK